MKNRHHLLLTAALLYCCFLIISPLYSQAPDTNAGIITQEPVKPSSSVSERDIMYFRLGVFPYKSSSSHWRDLLPLDLTDSSVQTVGGHIAYGFLVPLHNRISINIEMLLDFPVLFDPAQSMSLTLAELGLHVTWFPFSQGWFARAGTGVGIMINYSESQDELSLGTALTPQVALGWMLRDRSDAAHFRDLVGIDVALKTYLFNSRYSWTLGLYVEVFPLACIDSWRSGKKR